MRLLVEEDVTRMAHLPRSGVEAEGYALTVAGHVSILSVRFPRGGSH
ncbi:MAG: hypothetical protein JNL62_22540 [Bryobacterales bacterium]|nr:hypothetical protein [Bryobacterales bacterium]